MHVQIHHSTVYRYDPPAAGAIQLLRLTPRDFNGQHVVRWRIELSADARLTPHEDAFGNLTHVFTAAGPLAELRVDVDGEVETHNTHGVVSGAVERFPPRLFLRPTRLTAADEAIRDFAERARGRCVGASARFVGGAASRSSLRRGNDRGGAERKRSLRAQARRLPRPLPHFSRRRAPPRYSSALYRRLSADGRWPDRAGVRPRLGRSEEH